MRWRTEDPREVYFDLKGVVHILIASPHGSASVYLDAWTIVGLFYTVSADDPWPDGWRWIPYPDEPKEKT